MKVQAEVAKKARRERERESERSSKAAIKIDTRGRA